MASALLEQNVTPSKVPLPAEEEEEQNVTPSKIPLPAEEDDDDDNSESHVEPTAVELLQEGKKRLAEGDISSAVNVLQDSCSLLAKEFGETANECGEAYMVYGKALLELARIENCIVGEALEGMPLEELGEVENEEDVGDTDLIADKEAVQTEEEMEALREQVYDAMSEEKLPSDAREDVASDDENGEVVCMQVEQNDFEAKPVIGSEPSAEDRAAEGDRETENAQQEVADAGEKRTGADSSSVEEKQSGADSGNVDAKQTGADCGSVGEKPTGADCSSVEEKQSGADSGNVDAKQTGADCGSVGEKPTGADSSSVEEKQSGADSGNVDAKQTGADCGSVGEKQTGADCSNEDKLSPASGRVEKPASPESKPKEQTVAESVGINATMCTEGRMEDAPHSHGLHEPAGQAGDDVDTDDKGKSDVVSENDANSEMVVDEHNAPQEASAKDDSKSLEDSSMDGTTGPKEDSEESDENDTAKDHEETKLAEDVENSREEVSNMQLSWEMLDLARVICTRQRDRKAQLHAAEALLKLGELGMVKGASLPLNYFAETATQLHTLMKLSGSLSETSVPSLKAIGDFLQCLAIQQKYLEPDSRHLAETFYQLGVAYSLQNNHSEAAKHFSSSLRCINKRLAVLSEGVKNVEAAEKAPGVEFALAEDKKEIEALQDLLPEIQSRILDSEELQEEPGALPVLMEATVDAVGEPKTILGKVKDISHLVKKKFVPVEDSSETKSPQDDAKDSSQLVKKRKLEGEDAKTSPDTKKPKQSVAEELPNGAEKMGTTEPDDIRGVNETSMEVVV